MAHRIFLRATGRSRHRAHPGLPGFDSTRRKQSFGTTVQISKRRTIILFSFNHTIQILRISAHYDWRAETKTNVVRTVWAFDPFEIGQGDTCKRMRYPDLTFLICDSSGSTFLIRVGL